MSFVLSQSVFRLGVGGETLDKAVAPMIQECYLLAVHPEVTSACIEVKHYGSYLVEAYLRLVVTVGSYVSLCVVVAEEHVVYGEGCTGGRLSIDG